MESVPGAYVQYTFNLNDQLMLMGGIRGDYSSEYGFFVHRVHTSSIIRMSICIFVCLPVRDTVPIMYWRRITISWQAAVKCKIAPHLDQEEAWNYGASVSTYIPVFGKTLNVNAEYYYTDFLKQVVVDMDSNPQKWPFIIWMDVLIRMCSK